MMSLLSIAEQTRKRKYNGGVNAPLLMDLGADDVKEGQVYYNHAEYMEIERNRRWQWLAPVEVTYVLCFPCFGENRLVAVLQASCLLPGRRSFIDIDFQHYIRTLNTEYLPVPSEPFMVFYGLGLPEDLMVEVMFFMGMDKDYVHPYHIKLESNSGGGESDGEE